MTTAAKSDAEKRQYCFVYGTLKSTERNHHQMFSKSENGSIFVGHAKTQEKFPLVVATPFHIPFLLYKEGTGHNVVGEVYLLDEATLAFIDWFEDHPRWYTREKIPVSVTEGETSYNPNNVKTIDCWAYGLPTSRIKSSLLDLPMLEGYHDLHSESPRARPYNFETDGTVFHYLFKDNDENARV